MMQALQQVIAAVGNRTRLAEEALSWCREQYGGDHGFLVEREATTGGLKTLATFGEVEQMLEQDMRMFAQYAADHPAEPDSVMIAPDAEKVKALTARKSVRRGMTAGVIVFPLAAGNQPMGAVYLGRRETGAFTREGIPPQELLDAGQVLGRMMEQDQIRRQLELQLRGLREDGGAEEPFDGFRGQSEEIQRVRRSLGLVAEAEVAVTLVGEKGTGKGRAAEELHRASTRQGKPFIHLPLDDLPPEMHEALIFGSAPGTDTARGRRGALRDVKGGTLYLAGVDRLPRDVQDRLVGAMDRGEAAPAGGGDAYPVKARFVFGVHGDPSTSLDADRYSEAFHRKLHIFPVIVPPLRDRIEDLPQLVEHYAEQAALVFARELSGISSDVYDFLGTHDWPGNLEELEAEVRQAVLRTPEYGTLTPSVLSPHLIGQQQPTGLADEKGTLKQRVARVEKRIIMEALQRHRHNQSATAEQLGLSRQALINKLHRYGIQTGREYKKKMREIESKAKGDKS